MSYNDKNQPYVSQEIKKQIFVLSLSLLLSIFLGYIPNWTGVQFSVPEQTLLSIGLFISFLLLDILWIISSLAASENQEHGSWIIRNEGDKLLANIRTNFFRIVQDAYSPKDLFVLYFLEEFEQIAHKIKEAADSFNLRLASNHLFVGQGLFDSATYGGEDLVIRYIWILNDCERLFDDYPWKRYFEQLCINAKNGNIKAIKIIFVVESFQFLSVPRNKFFLDFLHCSKGFDCRIILSKDLKNLGIQNSISQTFIDFGIYGTRLLFLTERYTPETVGIFTKDPAMIRTYITFFEIMWSSKGITRVNPSTSNKAITLDELLTFDEQPDLNTTIGETK